VKVALQNKRVPSICLKTYLIRFACQIHINVRTMARGASECREGGAYSMPLRDMMPSLSATLNLVLDF